MFYNFPRRFALFMLVASAVAATGLIAPYRVRAVTVEVARKCEALTAQAYPPREPGNPAAGSVKGTGTAQNQYFAKCVANGGNADDKVDNKPAK